MRAVAFGGLCQSCQRFMSVTGGFVARIVSVRRGLPAPLALDGAVMVRSNSPRTNAGACANEQGIERVPAHTRDHTGDHPEVADDGPRVMVQQTSSSTVRDCLRGNQLSATRIMRRPTSYLVGIRFAGCSRQIRMGEGMAMLGNHSKS